MQFSFKLYKIATVQLSRFLKIYKKIKGLHKNNTGLRMFLQTLACLICKLLRSKGRMRHYNAIALSNKSNLYVES